MQIENLARAVRIALAISPLLLTPQILKAQDVDLGNLGDRGFRIQGIDADDFSGYSVSGAGDVNGDGLADLIIGAYGANLFQFGNAGESYIVFGKADTTVVDLANLGADGFQITGNRGDKSGYSVSGAGDVNGDGLSDLIIGAPDADPGSELSAGSSFVVFGKADSTGINLNSLGSDGFRIDGIDAGDRTGISVSGAGDVNGDGLDDLIVGASEADQGADSSAGESYVVFGKSSSTPVNLQNLGSNGFRIDGIGSADRSGRSVSGAGDVNGDGLADLIVGAYGVGTIFISPFTIPGFGESYVVFGKASSTTVDLANLGSGGFRIDGIGEGDQSGFSVSGLGDINGDGLADLIVGAPGAANDRGESYVVFGKASEITVDLDNLGSDGFRIDGSDSGGNSGLSVAGAGDINGDGLSDLIIGVPGATSDGNSYAGRSYVVFGKTSNTHVDLATLGSQGFSLDGVDLNDLSGRSVSGAGDVNGDGLADLIIGADGGDPGLGSNAGESYVVFSTALPQLSAEYRIRSRNGNPPQMAVGITGEGSKDGTPDARFWIDFVDGEDFLSSASTEAVTISRFTGPFTAPAAEVSWRFQSNRQNWSSAEITVRYLDSELLTDNENALQLFFSPNGSAPFIPLESVVNPLDNTISANSTQTGFFYIGTDPEFLFKDSFESP